jgi:hypothetical protein
MKLTPGQKITIKPHRISHYYKGFPEGTYLSDDPKRFGYALCVVKGKQQTVHYSRIQK